MSESWVEVMLQPDETINTTEYRTVFINSELLQQEGALNLISKIYHLHTITNLSVQPTHIYHTGMYCYTDDTCQTADCVLVWYSFISVK